MNPTRWFPTPTSAGVALLAALAVLPVQSEAATVSRLTPPSMLFSFGDAGTPVTSRFLAGQYFDLQATVQPDAGQTIVSAVFKVDGKVVPGTVALQTAGLVGGLPAGTTVVTQRRYSNGVAGIHNFTVEATLSDSTVLKAEGNFEVVKPKQQGRRAKNVIFCIGDGLGIAHRTAARIVKNGVQQGKANGLLAMDTFPTTGIVMTHSLNSIITDSSPGAACYSTGNKANNNQEGVFPDDTLERFDNPRVEYLGAYLLRTSGKTMGIVTTADVFDATPAAFAVHTQDRGAGTGICDQYLDEGVTNRGLRVLMGGGRKWFLGSGTNGSARVTSSDYVLPADVASRWSVPAGAIDPSRDLIGGFQAAGFYYAPDKTGMDAAPGNTTRLLGLFSFSNMNVAKDKVDKRRGASTVVDDYGFPDQPMLDEMTGKALQVLSKNNNGFTLMVEAASIDKQAHNMDSERWMLDTLEFDRAIAVARAFASTNTDTLVVVVADHECGGVNIIGASRVANTNLVTRSISGLSTNVGGPRNGVVGTYEAAGFPVYTIEADGYPTTTDPDFKMLIGYAANADRYEDWLTNPYPLRDSQQPFNNSVPLNTYPNGPVNRDTNGLYFVTGQVQDTTAVHTASDIPVYAEGRGANLFRGTIDNTDVFFRVMQAVLGGSPNVN